MLFTLFLLFFAFWLLQMSFWGGIFWCFFKKKPYTLLLDAVDLPPISVIICAKNEARNLRLNLPAILQQKYPNFEVWVVDDASTDDTATVLQTFAKTYKHLHIYTVAPDAVRELHGKKYALTQGLRCANYEVVLLTDADCAPENAAWIRTMATALRQDAAYEIVLGYSPYLPQKGVLNNWIRFETIYTALQYMSLAQIGLPYMGVGRNLLYRKALFAQSGGLTADADLLSGDDDLFVRDAATARNTAICLHPHSFVLSAPKTNLRDYLQQKSRHLTTSVRYKPFIQFILGSLSLSQMGVYVFFVAQIFLQSPFLAVAIFLFLIRFLVAQILFYKTCTRLNDKTLALRFLFFDMLLVVYLCYFATFFWRKPQTW
jgi:poly-beta-1,6-N-acetyl-D-glucosamine synthase